MTCLAPRIHLWTWHWGQARGDGARAARLYGGAYTLRETIGTDVFGFNRARDDRLVQTLREKLGEVGFSAAWDAGRALSLEEVTAEALTVQAPPATPSAAAQHGLTARELEVLRLLLEGCSDREIGERLFISQRTAQTHVQKIFFKLDVHSRAQAVALAMAQHIV